MLEESVVNKVASKEFEVTPWEVKGKVDYEKLMKIFGTKLITKELKEEIKRLAGGDLHMLIRRNIFYTHRDLDLIIQDYRENKGFFLYTGIGPSGPMHIGHLIPFVLTQWFQEKFDTNVYIEITDDEKFLVDKVRDLNEAKKWAYENILDIIALGFNPDKTFIFLDSEYIGNMYPLLVKIAKKLSFNEVKSAFGFSGESNIGIIFFPALQIAPTFFEKRRCLIPCAIDQDPYWRLQRDIAEGLGFFKTAVIHSKFLPPLTGPGGKMSSSQPDSAIFLNDDDRNIKRKIWKAFSGGQPTIELHRKLGGNPDIDVPFQWLKMFFEYDDNKLKMIEEDYRSGKLLSGEMKQILIDKVLKFMERHREQRERAKELIHVFMYEGKLAQEMWEKIHEVPDIIFAKRKY